MVRLITQWFEEGAAGGGKTKCSAATALQRLRRLCGPGLCVTPAALWCMRMTTLCLRRLASSGSLEHCLRSGVRLCMPVCSGGRVFELGACCLPNEWIHFDLWSKPGSLQARIAVQTLGLTTLECLRSHQFRQLSHHRRLHVPRGDGVEQPQGL